MALKNVLFDEVAIDPNCLTDENLLDVIRYKFGLGLGRCISEFPTDWKSKALEAANKIDDELLKKKIKLVIRRCIDSNSFIRSDRVYQRGADWFHQISESSKVKPFRAVISNEKLEFENSYLTSDVDNYLTETSKHVGGIDFALVKTDDEFIDLLKPFLLKNKCFTLVNKTQWLLTDVHRVERWFKVLMAYWVKNGGREATIIRSTNEEKGFREHRWLRERELLDLYLAHIGYKGIFKYIAVDDSRYELHKRSLLGNFCGIGLDFGLEMTLKRHPWWLMNPAEFFQEQRLFVDQDVRDTYPAFLEYRFAGL
jgi:hypothetical protein